MSHIAELKLAVRNLGCLGTAGAARGLVLVKKPTYRWYETWVGDYPLPEGIKREDLGKCDYALSIPGNSQAYEVGVKLMPDGTYKLLWDFWKGGYGLEQAIGKDGCKLISEYEAAVYREQAVSQGYEISEIILADGSREITAIQY